MDQRDSNPPEKGKSHSLGQLLGQRWQPLKPKQVYEPIRSTSVTEELPGDVLALMHQLQVHQIELEMQNEELRRTQWELETARMRYFDLYDLAPVGYCTLSENGIILEANLMAATLLGVDRAALVNRPISRFIFPAHQDVYYLNRKSLIESEGTHSWEMCMIKQDGKPVWTHIAATFEQNSGEAPLQKMVMSDISQRKNSEEIIQQAEERYRQEHSRHEEILQAQNARLQLATAAAERSSAIASKANLAKSNFLSGMSHELRTPLNAILGFAQLFETTTPPPSKDQQRYIEQISKAGWYLLELINDILDLALIESGKLSIFMESVCLPDVLQECRDMVEIQAQKRDIKMNFCDASLFAKVQADRIRLKQILINLLTNAIKYNKDGGTVTLDCQLTPQGRVRISIADSGAGLTPEKIAQLFQPFNRPGYENSNIEGTGIGLVMSKRLIELMGGEIGLKSTLNCGSLFWIDIRTATTTANINPTDVIC